LLVIYFTLFAILVSLAVILLLILATSLSVAYLISNVADGINVTGIVYLSIIPPFSPNVISMCVSGSLS